MSLLGDAVAYGIFWLFGWYIFIIGGIILIIGGIYFGLFFIIVLGVILLIDGIIGLVLKKKVGKKLGYDLAGSIAVISFGILVIFYFGLYLGLFVGLIPLLIGALSIFFSIRKDKKEKLKENLNEEVLKAKLKELKTKEEKHIKVNEDIGDIICDFLEENKGKAFTPNSIKNRCEELKNVDFQEIKEILNNLICMGKIAAQQKEVEIFYHAI